MNILERAEQGQSFIVADGGKFLSKLTLNQYDSESITNNYGSSQVLCIRSPEKTKAPDHPPQNEKAV